MLAQDVPNLIELPHLLEPPQAPLYGVSPSTFFPQESRNYLPTTRAFMVTNPITMGFKQDFTTKLGRDYKGDFENLIW
ncbi:hypothetical protein DYE48_19165 [Halobacillus trueperi]|uniref:Uncharacterized protein n=1 Tax=Halobacillus trueperi TaxID=156205 RepID=A0A3E0J012_9BACI|nr:hypothetical protein DYE48_19165 [Halobacillus trueperi]